MYFFLVGTRNKVHHVYTTKLHRLITLLKKETRKGRKWTRMRKSGGEYEKEATAPRHGGGAPKPASVKAITGATPVKQYVEKIETEIESEEITAKKKTSSSTGARNVKGKGVGKPAEKARRRNPCQY